MPEKRGQRGQRGQIYFLGTKGTDLFFDFLSGQMVMRQLFVLVGYMVRKNKSVPFLISRGQVFRLPARWAYEDVVDFMVVDIPDEQYGHSIVAISGNKAGLLVVRLPVESGSPGTHGISREWIVKNWAKWVYPDCPIENVYLFGRAEVPDNLLER